MEITQDEFDTILERRVRENVNALLSIPGIYELLAEEFNNDVLKEWDESQEEDE